MFLNVSGFICINWPLTSLGGLTAIAMYDDIIYR
jgi:hypothetical protein